MQCRSDRQLRIRAGSLLTEALCRSDRRLHIRAGSSLRELLRRSDRPLRIRVGSPLGVDQCRPSLWPRAQAPSARPERSSSGQMDQVFNSIPQRR
ncbi:MAG TPA: hypothetical protein DEG43_10075 [Acidimicrobiaceae bacterium]|nr:hypothetical protein [Acidimicrobiaceae bacterium]